MSFGKILILLPVVRFVKLNKSKYLKAMLTFIRKKIFFRMISFVLKRLMSDRIVSLQRTSEKMHCNFIN